MVEAYIKGRELTVGVLGVTNNRWGCRLSRLSPTPSTNFLITRPKYQPGATREICPALVEDWVRERRQQYAVRAHQALQLRGYSRTDMILQGEELYLLETNTIPGMTPTSSLPQAAAEAGIPFAELLDRLIALALEKTFAAGGLKNWPQRLRALRPMWCGFD